MRDGTRVWTWLVVGLVVLAPVLVWAAETELTVQSATDSGVLLTMNSQDLSNGNWFYNDGRTVLFVAKDSGADASTMTLVTAATLGGFAVANQTVALAAGATTVIGPFNPAVYNDSTSHGVVMSYSAGTTGVTVGVVRVAGF